MLTRANSNMSLKRVYSAKQSVQANPSINRGKRVEVGLPILKILGQTHLIISF